MVLKVYSKQIITNANQQSITLRLDATQDTLSVDTNADVIMIGLAMEVLKVLYDKYSKKLSTTQMNELSTKIADTIAKFKEDI